MKGFEWRLAMSVAPPITITTAISDFLGNAPTLEEIVVYQLPEFLEGRALELLERNRNGDLSPEETAELEEFSRMGHFMNRVKLRARMALAGEE
jgi:hypothetical protein